jgi:hypothetical protein
MLLITINKIFSNIIRTKGDKSNAPILGTVRLTGRSKGMVKLCIKGATGLP